ncbi:MAG: thiopurine S-methyltransferase [Pseudomonadota bacterium]
MEEAFWQARWRDGKTAFHEGRSNRFLSAHLSVLGLSAGDTVYVPLCGKAVDLDWLLEQGYRVVGAEFNRGAVEAVFERLGLARDERGAGELVSQDGGRLRIFVGDVFDVTAEVLGPVQAVYDRAATVALPPALRARYAGHVAETARGAQQLVISFDYEQSQTEGPPFSVPAGDLARLHAGRYRGEVIDSAPISGPLAARCAGTEFAMHLAPIPGAA